MGIREKAALALPSIKESSYSLRTLTLLAQIVQREKLPFIPLLLLVTSQSDVHMSCSKFTKKT